MSSSCGRFQPPLCATLATVLGIFLERQLIRDLYPETRGREASGDTASLGYAEYLLELLGSDERLLHHPLEKLVLYALM